LSRAQTKPVTDPLPKPIPLSQWADDFDREADKLANRVKLYRDIAKGLRRSNARFSRS
jgi:hypothetical protein